MVLRRRDIQRIVVVVVVVVVVIVVVVVNVGKIDEMMEGFQVSSGTGVKLSTSDLSRVFVPLANQEGTIVVR